MKKKTKKTLIEYGVIGVVVLTLYLTGLHTNVIGFVQRGLLATGLMNPKIEARADHVSNSTEDIADFNLELINSSGEKVHLEQFKGKVIFMNLWATWCPPCIAEMPSIQKLYHDVKDENVEFIMLSLDDKFDTAKSFRIRKGYDFEIYQIAGRLPQMYHSSSIPTTFVIGADGQLAMTHKGMADYSTKKFKSFLRDLQ